MLLYWIYLEQLSRPKLGEFGVSVNRGANTVNALTEPWVEDGQARRETRS